MSVLAEDTFVFVQPTGERATARIALGLPFKAPGGEYRCEVTVGTVEPKPLAIAGDSSLQALLLAIRFAATRLHHFTERGGRVLFLVPDEKGEDADVPLGAYFGPLLAPP